MLYMMKRTALMLCLAFPAVAQPVVAPPVAAPASAPPLPVGSPVVVPRPPLAPVPATPHVGAGARVELLVFDEVTTKTAQAGQRFKLKLAQPLLSGDRVLIPRGVSAWGEVTSATANGIAGKSGKLGTKLLYIDFNGQRIGIAGAPANAGQAGNLQIVMATLALTPWGLFAKGNNAKLKAGEIVFAYLTEDFPRPLTPPAAAAPPPAAQP